MIYDLILLSSKCGGNFVLKHMAICILQLTALEREERYPSLSLSLSFKVFEAIGSLVCKSRYEIITQNVSSDKSSF